MWSEYEPERIPYLKGVRTMPPTTCSKVSYPNRGAAVLSARRIARRRGDGRHERAAYPCPLCAGPVWHLTSQKARGFAVAVG